VPREEEHKSLERRMQDDQSVKLKCTKTIGTRREGTGGINSKKWLQKERPAKKKHDRSSDRKRRGEESARERGEKKGKGEGARQKAKPWTQGTKQCGDRKKKNVREEKGREVAHE